jgi:DNA-directed RNA polymerase sigma subunit (sigma70/sigma32)
VTRERVRQIEAKAVEKLRDPSVDGHLADYLDHEPVVANC